MLQVSGRYSLETSCSPKILPWHIKHPGFWIAHSQMSPLWATLVYKNPSGFIFLINKFSNLSNIDACITYPDLSELSHCLRHYPLPERSACSDQVSTLPKQNTTPLQSSVQYGSLARAVSISAISNTEYSKYDDYNTLKTFDQPWYCTRSSFIHSTCNGVAPLRLAFACGVTWQGEETPMQAKLIKLDLVLCHHLTQEQHIITNY